MVEKMQPGLYKTGTTELLRSWQECLDLGLVGQDGDVCFANEENIILRFQLNGDLVIPEDVTYIRVAGFKMCLYLKKVVLPSNF